MAQYTDTESAPPRIPGYARFTRLSESQTFVTYRAVSVQDQQAVVIKTVASKFPKKEDLARLNKEHELLAKLSGEHVPAVLAVVNAGQPGMALVNSLFGVSLTEYVRRYDDDVLPLESFFTICQSMVDALGHVHDHQVIHKDVNPSNFLVDPESLAVRITDFGSASELGREFKEVSMSSLVEGTLAYIAPEQTGRMNRDVDYRSDYYALGVTFFQLLTGQLPFLAQDALEMVHYHISKTAPGAREVNPDVPASLTELLRKLMAKNAEERYQSAFGIKYDLWRCEELYHAGQVTQTFPLGTEDISREFSIPQNLYGREKELGQLEDFFDAVGEGNVKLCLIAGYSGVGKSALVYELARSIAGKNGFLVAGKFDQYRQNTAYFALAQAFSDLITQLLGEPEDKITGWKEKISAAIHPYGQLIVDLIPELSVIIGPQPAVQQLTPAESQNRFLLLFAQFVRVFATAEHPLVLFLDDLQWSDIPSLRVIERLVTSPTMSHLLIVGTYRDNEVNSRHPLFLRLREIRRKRIIETIELEPLPLPAIARLTADTLNTSGERVAELAQTLYAKTRGNPFFTVQLLKNLYERKAIFLDAKQRRWSWDIDQVKELHHSDNVIDILVASQEKLGMASQAVLQLASCIGATFDLQTLSVIYERSPLETARALLEPVRTDMIVSLDQAYQYFDLIADEHTATNPTFRFQHDRIQQAAYQRIPEEKKESLHLSIGRLMISHATPAELDDRVIDIVGHLNAGKALIREPEERREFARLNLAAGVKAKQSAAYQAALEYLVTGFEALSAEAWEDDFKLSWEIAEQLQHCYYLTGNWDEAESWAGKMLEYARSDLERGRVYAIITRQYATTGKMRESIEAAYHGFRILGFELIEAPTSGDVRDQIARVKKNLGRQAVADLIGKPAMKDPKAIIASQLFMEIFAAAFLSGSGEKFPYVVLSSVNLALEYGSGPESAFAYAAYGMLLCGYLQEPALGNEFGKLGIEMIEKFDGLSLKSRIYYVYTMFVSHWSNHWSSMTPLFKIGIETGYQSGDLLYLAYSAQDCIIWDPTIDLETAAAEHRKMLEIVKECDYQDSYDSGTLFLQMQMNFLGKTEAVYSLTDHNFDEAACVAGMRGRHFMTGIANYNIYKAEIHLLYNDFAGGLPYVLAQEELRASVMSLPQQARFCLVSFLTYSRSLPDAEMAQREAWSARMREGIATMRLWAATCQDNFQHLVYFMEAEMTRLDEGALAALPGYERAVQAARQSGFRRDEGMINEFAGRALLDLELAKAARGYLHAAYFSYYQWGATRKTDLLRKTYPDVFDSPLATAKNLSQLSGDGKQSTSFNADLLDISSLFRASQAISGELILDKLLEATLRILIENAGAQHGLIVEKTDHELVVRSAHREGHPGTAGDKPFPTTMLNVCFRTDQTIVIDDANKPNDFSSDPYVLRHSLKSVMCVPLPKYGKMNAAIYFENNLTHSAFTEERVEVIKLLASQASVSLENARIYAEQTNLLQAQQRFVPNQFLRQLGHKDIGRVQLGESTAVNMSVMFSDIRDFTPMVEALSPEAVIELLNSYYSELGAPISEYGGFIDSYTGDQIMALFSAEAKDALRAGISMSEALRKWNEVSRASGRPELEMGIGLNTGPLVMGTMGDGNRIQCTVIGDTVNLASRIEQLTKVYQCRFLVGERTYELVKADPEFSLRMVDYVAVKGRAGAVRLYEVLNAEPAERRRKKESTKLLLDHGIAAYFQRDFATAAKYFAKGSGIDPLDTVFKIYHDRAGEYLKNPPDKNWQGFEKLNKK